MRCSGFHIGRYPPLANQAPTTESQPIHRTQQLPGSALSGRRADLIRWPARKRALGLLKRARFGGEFGLHSLQRGSLFADLKLEAADGPAEFCELVRSPRLHLVEVDFEAAYGHGEFGAQLILIGLNLRHRQRGQSFQPTYGEAYRARVHQRNNADNEQARDQKPDPDIHNLFDHDASRTPSALILTRMPRRPWPFEP